jgi:cation channel sperm-associated protein 2
MIGLGNRTSVVATVIRKISIFRILRSLRMISKFDGLRIIVLTALQALQSLVFITLLLLIVGYIFAIVGVIFFGSLSVASDDEAGRFQNLLDAMIILFQLFTLDQWLNIYVKLSSIAGPVLTTFYILLWIWIGSFVFRNLFVGIMVNNFQNISSSLLEQQNNMVESMELAKKKEELDLEINKQENRMCTTRKSLFDPHFLTGIPELEDSSCTPEISDDLLKQQKSHISQLILTEEKMAEGWDEMVHENLKALSTDPVQTLWPRDTLFKYYQLMEQLQENMEEYNELQQLIGTPMVPVTTTLHTLVYSETSVIRTPCIGTTVDCPVHGGVLFQRVQMYMSQCNGFKWSRVMVSC